MRQFDIGADRWAGLTKVVEETSELNVELAKLQGSGGDPNHWSGNLIPKIEDEMADTYAAMAFFLSKNPQISLDRIEARAKMKAAKFDGWHDEAQRQQFLLHSRCRCVIKIVEAPRYVVTYHGK